MLEKEEIEIWEKYYPKGKVVLDVGCSYDTPYFFLRHGAKKVIAIDSLPMWFWDSRIHFACGKVDAIKIDIEGAERGMIIETHYPDPKLSLLHTFESGTQIWRLE